MNTSFQLPISSSPSQCPRAIKLDSKSCPYECSSALDTGICSCAYPCPLCRVARHSQQRGNGNVESLRPPDFFQSLSRVQGEPLIFRSPGLVLTGYISDRRPALPVLRHRTQDRLSVSGSGPDPRGLSLRRAHSPHKGEHIQPPPGPRVPQHTSKSRQYGVSARKAGVPYYLRRLVGHFNIGRENVTLPRCSH